MERPPTPHDSAHVPLHPIGWLGWLARALCLLLGAVGALPVVAAALSFTPWFQDLASEQTASLLSRVLGLKASYSLKTYGWPLAVELTDVKLSAEGRSIAHVDRLLLRPPLLELLSGRISAGEVLVEGGQVSLEFDRAGNLTNVPLRLPQGAGGEDSPLSSLKLRRVDVLIHHPGLQAELDSLHAELEVARANAFDLSLTLDRGRVITYRGSSPEDRDLLCSLTLALSRRDGQWTLRNLVLQAALAPGQSGAAQPTCPRTAGELPTGGHLLLLSSRGITAAVADGEPRSVEGQVQGQLPLELVDRYWIPERLRPLKGPVFIEGTFAWTPEAALGLAGRFEAGHLSLSGITLAKSAHAAFDLKRAQLSIPVLHAAYGDGEVAVRDISLDFSGPGMPLRSRTATITGVKFPDLMRDTNVTPNTIIQWNLDNLTVDNFGGSLVPIVLDGQVNGQTSDFVVFDKAFHKPDRRRIVGVRSARISTFFGARDDSLLFRDIDARFGSSQLLGDAKIGFASNIEVRLTQQSTLSLADISPLASLPIGGHARLGASLRGTPDQTKLVGNLDIDNFSLATFPLGHVSTTELEFIPMRLSAQRVTVEKGESRFLLGDTSLSFDTDAAVAAEASILPNRFSIRDFMSLFELDKDPRWLEVSGTARAIGQVRYVVDGKDDRCGSGDIRVTGEAFLDQLELFGERYTSGRSDLSLHWFDPDASYLGLDLRLPNLQVKKGTGDLLGSLSVQRGGVLSGSLSATRVPLSSLRALGKIGGELAADLSGVGVLGGRLDAIEGRFRGTIGRLTALGAQWPESTLQVELRPKAMPLISSGLTPCGLPRPAPFQADTFLLDESSGDFVIDADLLGGQVRLTDVHLTQQRAKRLSGLLRVSGLQLGPLLAGLRAGPDAMPTTQVSLGGQLRMLDVPLNAPARGTASLELSELRATQGPWQLQLTQGLKASVGDGTLQLQPAALRAALGTEQVGMLDLRGTVTNLASTPSLNLQLSLSSAAVSGLKSLVPNVDRLAGTLEGRASVAGTVDAPQLSGDLHLRGGRLSLQGEAIAIEGANLDLALADDRLRLLPGGFRYGEGSVQLWGEAPVTGLRLGETRLEVRGNDLSFTPAPGVELSTDAELSVRWNPQATPIASRTSAPHVTGALQLERGRYTRPVKMSVTLNDLAQRGRRTEVDSYQPDGDWISFDVTVAAREPFRLSNNLVEARVDIEGSGLRLVGTNQRFGASGALRLLPGGHLTLRRSEFEIQAGQVRFEDPTHLSPLVDVTATTNYRRFSTQLDAGAVAVTSTQSNSSGEYRVKLRAHGNADALQVDLSSEPSLSSEDIFPLLTLGVTRTELDQIQQLGGGGNVALEALGALTGADEAVTEAVGVIDEFRFGSAYSANTGRPEPTVTIGKRLSDRLRAFVTTGLADAREVRSNVEMRLNPRVSLEGSYDNVNAVTSSSLGNLGANLRWRLRFE